MSERPRGADRLETERNVWLATVRPDGRPHLVPVWFVWVDGACWIGTGATSVKARNLASGKAAVSLEDGDAPVVAEVEAVEAARPFPEPVVAAFAAKYDWNVRAEDDEDIGEVAMFELRPTRWLLGGPT